MIMIEECEQSAAALLDPLFVLCGRLRRFKTFSTKPLAAAVHKTVIQLIGLYADVTTTESWIADQACEQFHAGQFDG